jgi:hypothetical protein
MGFEMKFEKRAQVTVFIILAMVIVGVMVLFFLWDGSFDFSRIDSPEEYLEDCVSSSIDGMEISLLESNGYPEKDFQNYVLYNGESVPYLCVSSEFYTGCMPQEPMFAERLRKIIENKVARDFENCFNDVKQKWEKQGYDVSASNSVVEVSFNDDYIITNIDKNIVATKDGSSVRLENLAFNYPTSFFKLIKLVQTIVNYESTACEFNEINWMRYSPGIMITRFRTSDQTKIYSLKDRVDSKEIKFAIKTCVLPAGM